MLQKRRPANSAPLHVLIIGASSGLGEAIAHQYAERGAKVALFARRRERLEAVATACRERGAHDARVLVGDTTIPADIATAVAELDQAWGRIDRAFLNAGGSAERAKVQRSAHFIECCSGQDLTAAEFSAESAEWVMRLNYLGVVYWIDPLLRRMRKQGAGTITVTGSMSADGGLPRSGPYTASKLALRALLEGLRHDAGKYGVRLCLIECGWFVSELTEAVGYDAPFLQTTADAARCAIAGAEAAQAVIRFPWQMSLISRIGTMLPRRLRDRAWDFVLPPLKRSQLP